jgi:hypothetical protein
VQVLALADVETDRLLAACGMRSICDCVRAHQAPLPSAAATPEDAVSTGEHAAGTEAAQSRGMMAADIGLSMDVVMAAMQDLFALATAADAVPDYEKIMMPRLRVVAGRRVAEGLLAAYKLVFDALHDTSNGFEVQEGSVKQPALVATLLGVQDS